MTLWLLRPISSEPWKPWYDKAFGFVVRAETDEEARRLASNEAGDEGDDAWLNATLSSCEELTPEGDPAVILQDFHSA